MLIDGKRIEVLSLDDIGSLISLEAWLKSNLTIFSEDEKISSNELGIFIEYLKEVSVNQRVKDKRDWLDKFDDLTSWLDSPRRKNLGKDDGNE